MSAPCPTPNKQAYSTPADAKSRAAWLAKRGERDIHEYRCRCGKWHIGHPHPAARAVRQRKANR